MMSMISCGRVIDYLCRGIGILLVGLTVTFLLAPAIVVLSLSFSNETFFAFPPGEWGLRQYRTLFSSTTWLEPVKLSFQIALPTAGLALITVMPALVAINRSRLRGTAALQLAGIGPLLIPLSAYAVAMYSVFAQFGLLGSFWGLVLAHTILAIPLVLVVVGAAFAQISEELELVAMVLGASRFRAFVGVTLPLLLPGIIAASLLAFDVSFNEAVFINFLGGPGLVTLPKAIFDSVRFGVDPVVTAIATLLMLGTSLVVIAATKLRRSVQ